MDTEFVGDHYDPRGAKATLTGFQKRPYGSMNIADRGHPHPTSALDKASLCSFGGSQTTGVCANSGPSSRAAMQRAMLQKIDDSRRRSFRCVEEGQTNAMKRAQLRASARCVQMLGTEGAAAT